MCLCIIWCRSAAKATANEKKDRLLSNMSEASNYTGGSDYATHQNSPAGRVSGTHMNDMTLEEMLLMFLKMNVRTEWTADLLTRT